MAYNTSRSSRERRLRAKYRKKITTAALIMLIIGLVLGFVLCMVAAKRSDRMAQLLDLKPKAQLLVTATDAPEAESDAFATPAPMETQDPEAAPALSILPPDEAPVSAADGQTEVEPIPTEAEPANAAGDPTEAEPTQSPDGADAEDNAPAIVSMMLETPAATEAPVEAPVEPTAAPTADPAAEPAVDPVAEAAVEPVVEPAADPAAVPAVEPTAAPTAEAAGEPAGEPAAEPVGEPVPDPVVEPAAEPAAPNPEPVYVPYGEACTFDAQIRADGSARNVADGEAYETVNLTLKVNAYKDTAYFEEHYASSYNLQGNEAAVEFDLTLNGYAGSTEIIPQNFLLITLSGEGGESQGFQLMDTEIAGKTDVAVASDQPMTLYKRYPYNGDQGDMAYMVVTAYNEGVPYTYYFEIQAPQTEAEATPGADAADGATAPTEAASASGEGLTVGSQGEEVKKLQQVLIDKKLLSGMPDGKFGKYTAEAVKEMQRRFDMEPTGVADQAFLDKLYE